MKFILILLIQLFGIATFAQCYFCEPSHFSSQKSNQVTHLYLQNSPVEIIDTSFNQFTLVSEIDLSYSFVHTIDALVRLENLEKINLSHTYFDPLEIVQLGQSFPQLKSLNLSDCRLLFLPTSWNQLNQLEALDLSSNQLTFLPADLEKLQQLRILNLAQNQLTTELYALTLLWKLESLDVSGNPYLNANELSQLVQSRKNLHTLSMDASLMEQIPDESLQKWHIQKLILSDPTKEAIDKLKKIPTLKELELKNLSKEVIREELYLPSLQTLTIQGGFVTPNVLQNIQLDTLKLKQIENIQLTSFNSNQRIEFLDLSESRITKLELDFINELLPYTEVKAINYHIPQNNSNATLKPIVPISTQNHLISTDSPCTIKEKNATFFIPVGAFRNPDGSLYNGKAEIAIKIYKNAADLALDGAPMRYQTAGMNELFGSNAMLSFDAKSMEGTPLLPNPYTEIEVNIDNQLPQTLGNLYLYDSSSSNWKSINRTVETFPNPDRKKIERIIDSINRLDLSKQVNLTYNESSYQLNIRKQKNNLVTLQFDYHFMKKPDLAGVVVYNRTNFQGKVIAKNTWQLDTILDETSYNYLKYMSEESQFFSTKWIFFRRKKFWNHKNVIKQVSIEKDIPNDQYRIRFYFKDSLISLPVTLVQSPDNRLNIMQYRKLEKSFKNAEKLEQKERTKFNRSYEKRRTEAEKNLKIRLIQQTIQKLNNPLSTEKLRFGLTHFGLVNVDIIAKIKPIAIKELTPNFVDQMGKIWKSDKEIRLILFDINSYLPVRASYFPVYSNSVGLIPISDSFIGLFEVNKKMNENRIPLTLISIEGKTPEEISEQILKYHETH